MNFPYLLSLLTSALALIVGIVVHESAHALAAYVLGDRTARSQGRLSLNPLKHIDPFGTVLLPLIMILAGGPVFAFAKPVPVYLNNLKHPRRDEVLISLAGPASNILLAGIAALILRGIPGATLMDPYSGAVVNAVLGFAFTSISVNLSLAFSTSSRCPRSTVRRSSFRFSKDARCRRTMRSSATRCPSSSWCSTSFPALCISISWIGISL